MDALDLHDILSKAAQSRPRIGLADLSSAELSPIPSDAALARLLMIQLSDAPDETMVAPCVTAIATSRRWRDLIWEFVTNIPPSEQMVRVISGVFDVHVPEHPIASLAGRSKLAACNAFDAVDDGVHVRLKLDAGSSVLDMSEGHLVSLADPVDVWAGCAVVRREDDVLWLRVIRDSALFAEHRIVLPPAILIAAIN